MSGIKEMQLDERGIKSYQLDIILDNTCSLFLPATFARRDERGQMLFLSDGYTLLSEESNFNALECVDIIYDAFCKMREAMRRYIFPDEYIIAEDTIFVDISHKEVKLIFKPSCASELDSKSVFEYKHMASEKAICENIEVVCNMLKKNSADKANYYIDKALESIKKDNYGFENIIYNLRLLKKEVYRLAIDSREIRNAVRMDL